MSNKLIYIYIILILSGCSVNRGNMVYYYGPLAGVWGPVVHYLNEEEKLRNATYNIQAQNAYERGDYTTALYWFRKAESKNNWSSYNNIGWTLSNLKRHKEASETFKTSLKIEKSASAYNGLAWSYHYIGNYEKAIYYFDKALALSELSSDNSGLASAYKGLGWAQSRLGYHDKAIKSFKASLKHNENPNAWSGLGGCYYKKMEYLEALKCYNKAAIISTPDDKFKWDYHLYAGKSLIKLHRHEEAIEELKVSLNLKKNPDGFNQLGICYRLADRNNEALKAYKKAIELASDNNSLSGIYFEQGLSLHNLERYEDALISFQKSRSYENELSLGTYSWEISCYNNLKRQDDSYELIEEAKRKLQKQNDIKKLNTIETAKILMSEHKYKESIPLILEYLEYQDTPHGNYLISKCYSNIKDYQNAIKYITNAISSSERYSSSLANYHLNKGVYLYRMGRYEEALPSFNSSYALNPTYNCISWKVSCYINLKKFENGTKLLEKSLHSHGENKQQIYKNFAHLHEKNNELEKAIFFYKKSNKIKEEYYIYNHIGRLSLLLKQSDEAIKNYRKSLKITEKNPIKNLYSYKKLSDCYLMTGDYKEAKIILEKAMLIKDKSYLHRTLSWVYLWENNKQEREKSITKAKALSANTTEGLLRCLVEETEQLLYLGEFKEANRRLREIEKNKKTSFLEEKIKQLKLIIDIYNNNIDNLETIYSDTSGIIGLNISTNNNKIKARGIIQHSPAYLLGLRKNDIIIEFDNHPILKENIYKYHEKIDNIRADETFYTTIIRGDIHKRIKITGGANLKLANITDNSLKIFAIDYIEHNGNNENGKNIHVGEYFTIKIKLENTSKYLLKDLSIRCTYGSDTNKQTTKYKKYKKTLQGKEKTGWIELDDNMLALERYCSPNGDTLRLPLKITAKYKRGKTFFKNYKFDILVDPEPISSRYFEPPSTIPTVTK